MNEFKGTKSPWFVIDRITDENKKGFPSVVMHGTEKQYRESLGRTGLTINVGGTDESLNANAQLISCAPEMLEMLMEFDKNIGEFTVEQIEFGDRVRELIKKATTI